MKCPSCGTAEEAGARFCRACGTELVSRSTLSSEGERRQVTVLFSDLSGYTSLCEKVDPEEVREIMDRIFGSLTPIVESYGGTVDKYLGDGILVLFGAKVAHEDDPVRAVNTALDFHTAVESIGREMEERLGRVLTMHSGIETGFVVTRDSGDQDGKAGIVGDTINLASRLSDLAKDGEILLGPNAHGNAEAQFEFEAMDPVKVKGKKDPVSVYKVLSPKAAPRKVHRPPGRSAELTGRATEMALLQGFVEGLRKGHGRIVTITGEAGTGKSRLLEELRATLEDAGVSWHEGHSYSYSQSTSYFPFTGLLNRAFGLDERSNPEEALKKFKTTVGELVGEDGDIIPYLGNFLSLGFEEVGDLSPESWKHNVTEAIRKVLQSMAAQQTTVFSLEDLHWADPASLDLLRTILSDLSDKAIFLCTFRPPFTFFSGDAPEVNQTAEEILLEGLSAENSHRMMESLLGEGSIPEDLERFVQSKAEGNPLYVEEVLNSLLDSGVLLAGEGDWKLVKSLDAVQISPTIQGVLAARLDRLEPATKRLLQEASVIGRVFTPAVLAKVTALEEPIENHLTMLEEMDLIRSQSAPDAGYIFKHVLTQEVAYSGLLKKELEQIHERVGNVVEQLYQGRLSEAFETLAYHYSRSRSVSKAVEYLVKSAEKSRNRSALKESHHGFTQAYDLLTATPERTKEDEATLLDLLVRWAPTINDRTRMSEITEILGRHLDLTESPDEGENSSMLLGWLGWASSRRGKIKEGHSLSQKALSVSKAHGSKKGEAFASMQMCLNCAEFGLLQEAVVHGEKACRLSLEIAYDFDLIIYSHGNLAVTHAYRGYGEEIAALADVLLEQGRDRSEIRFASYGVVLKGLAQLTLGDFDLAISHLEEVAGMTDEPLIRGFTLQILGRCQLMTGQLDECDRTTEIALDILKEMELQEAYCRVTSAGVLLARGSFNSGMDLLERQLDFYRRCDAQFFEAQTIFMIGMFYLRVALRSGPRQPGMMKKNFLFLIKNLPVAARKAESNLSAAAVKLRKMGALSYFGLASLALGRLYLSRKKKDLAREQIVTAVEALETCKARVYLEQAREALASLDQPS